MTGMQINSVGHSILAVTDGAGGASFGGMMGGLLLSVGLVAWLAIAFFFAFGVLSRVHQTLDRKTAGLLTVPLFENYYLVSLGLQLLATFGALDLVIAAYGGLSLNRALVWLWLGLCLLLLWLSVIGRWSLVPGIRSNLKAVEVNAQEPERQAAERNLRQKHSVAKIMNAVQILVGLTALALFFVPFPSGEQKVQPSAKIQATSQPAASTKVIFRAPPIPSTPSPKSSAPASRPASSP